MEINLIYFYYFLIIALNICSYFFLNQFGQIINIYDQPNHRKVHKNKVPLIGGIFIFINIALAIIIFFENELIYFYIGFISFFLLGLFDDKKNIRASKKFLISILIIFLVVFFDNQISISSIKLSFISFSINLGILSIFFTIICMMLFINALNMFDGINGQSGSYCLILASYLILNGSVSNHIFGIILITLIFFLIWNLREKIFLGDSGTLSLGFLFSYFFIYSYNKGSIINADSIYIIMFLPGLDLMRLYIQRIYKGISPFKPDRNHIHHYFLKEYGYRKTLFFLIIFILTPIILDILIEKTLLINLITLFIYLYLIIVKFKNNFNSTYESQ